MLPQGPVPANLLRWHLVFDQPVDTGLLADGVQLLDTEGAAVPHAFVELPGGLWDASGTRMTVLMHPGRIKSGLRGQRDRSGALVPQTEMRLQILARSAAGLTTLVLDHRFEVEPAETRPLRLSDASLQTPRAGRQDALVLHFDRAMDLLSLDESVQVRNTQGRLLPGSWVSAQQGRQIAFLPDRPWSTGQHVLRVRADLEDLAGNRVAAPFERKQEAATQPEAPTGVISLPFRPRRG